MTGGRAGTPRDGMSPVAAPAPFDRKWFLGTLSVAAALVALGAGLHLSAPSAGHGWSIVALQGIAFLLLAGLLWRVASAFRRRASSCARCFSLDAPARRCNSPG